ncbi:MAG: undecaprenyl-phosphate glucose phosphotransferase [Muribaculaceae bacterium]|nr:undecaprenyl-phosphate glucose phosphotransferase [Muribaculaceae bacterium]
MTGLKQQRGRYGRYIPVFLTGIDFLLINIAVIIGITTTGNESVDIHMRTVWLLANLSYLPITRWSTSVHSLRPIKMERLLANSLRTIINHAFIFLSALYILRIDYIPWTFFATFYGACLILLPIWWLASRLIVKYCRRRGLNFSRVIIVGTNNTALRLLNELSSDAGFGYKFMGFFNDVPSNDVPSEFYRGSIDDLDTYIKENAIDEVFCTIHDENETAINRTIAIADSNATQYHYVPQFTKYVSRQFDTYALGTMPILSARSNPLKNISNRIVKRTFDVIVSATALILSPLVLIPLSIAIKISSPGPVFFKQRRTGYKGRAFICWKFRTMRVNDESDKRQATQNDNRITRLGRFLRHTSIDELPQLFNVLKGDMSLVGPRPHMLQHTDIYRNLITKYMARHVIKPGITGWAQIHGFRGPTEELWKMEKRVEYDVWYIENWSLMLDLKIIARTITNIFSGESNAV